jgi:hypothetical protein
LHRERHFFAALAGGTARQLSILAIGTSVALSVRVIKLATSSTVLLIACTSPIDVHGSFDNVEGLRKFEAADGFFDLGTHYEVFTNNGIEFTELHFASDPDACTWYTNSNAGSSLHYPLLQVQAAIYTGSPASQPTGVLDLSVKAPGEFPLAPAAASDAQANAGWFVEGTSTGYNGYFTAGAIHFSEVTDDRLVGTIDVQGVDDQVISGSFSLAHCAAADWAH